MAETATITLPIRRDGGIRFHEVVATAEVDGEFFRYSVALGSGALMFRIGDRQYIIETQDLCAAVVEYYRAEEEEEGDDGD